MDEELTPLEEMWNAYPWLSNNEVRGRLASSGLTAEHINNKMFNLSGGEMAKVRLCKLQVEESNWLILDEPTNHLDLDSIAAIESGLRGYDGALVVVSHDPDFLEAIAIQRKVALTPVVVPGESLSGKAMPAF